MRKRLLRRLRWRCSWAVTAYVHGPDVLAATSPLNCNLSAYQGTGGLNAAVTGDSLAVTWDGDRNQELRLRFVIDNGTPTIAELAARKKGGAWGDARDERDAGVPRRVGPAPHGPRSRGGAARERHHRDHARGLREVPVGSVLGRAAFCPGRHGERHAHARACRASRRKCTAAPRRTRRTSCEVKTDKTHLTVSFPGVTLGVFAGQLQFTVYKGSNLIQQEVVAKTSENSVAYKYDAGLKGLAIADSRLTWRDQIEPAAGVLVRRREQRARGAAQDGQPAAHRRARQGRLDRGIPAAAQLLHGARERRRTSATTGIARTATATFSFGIRQAEDEETPNIKGNFALYSARPGTLQHMPVFYLRQRRARRADARCGARLHARRSLQADRRLQDDGPSLPHEFRPCG